ncbi:MAG: CpaD family pilus assembly lipoprotein [Robiginitomaculum sp.]|nr:CpaD family pilus assembly lipoprotein [Robiginitomaculum sp.]
MITPTFSTLRQYCALGIFAVSPLFFGACTVHQSSFASTSLRNKITVAETVERMELYLGQDGLNLSMRDRDAMGNFLSQYAQSGQGPLYLNIPSNATKGVGQARNLVASQLASMGIGQTRMQMGQYAARANTPAPVIVSYRRLMTQPINCQQGANLILTGNNQPYGSFGCAQTANLAAMIDNPRQLLMPYALDHGSAARNALVLGKYRNNEATATPRPADQEISATD